MKAIIIVLFIISCSEIEDPGIYNTHDPYFDSDINDMLAEYRHYTGSQYTGKITVKFGTVGEREYARCIRPSLQIVVDEQRWHKASKIKHKLILRHEFGHCHMNREHTIRFIGMRPTSIMFEYIMMDKQYREHEDEYLRELYTYKRE